MNRAKELCERYRREIVLMLAVFLVASLSFGLGYLTARDSAVAPIVIENKE